MPRFSNDATADVWRKRLRRFARSGLPVVRFCAAEGVSVASFYNWRKKLVPHTPRGRRAGQRAAFRRVAIVSATPGASNAATPEVSVAAPAVCIHLPGGTRIEVRAEDLDVVRAVIAELVHNNEWARGAGRQD